MPLDALLLATFALPTTLLAAGAKSSSAIDLGSEAFKGGDIELELYIPTLNATMAPAAATGGVTYAIQSSSDSFSNVARTLASKTIAGSASGVAATTLKARVPSDCEVGVRGYVLLATTATDASAVIGTFRVRQVAA